MFNCDEVTGIVVIWRYKWGVVITEEYNVMVNTEEVTGTAII
jgi:hypothetical protein